MSALVEFIGSWSGDSQLFHESNTYDSKSSVEVSQNIQSQFIFVSYTWKIDGTSQDGFIIFNSQINQVPTKSDWLDSWHMRNDIMHCKGTMNEDGIVSLLGSYSAPSSPDWGWRIDLELVEMDKLEIRMFNITPQGNETLAVQATYERLTEAI